MVRQLTPTSRLLIITLILVTCFLGGLLYYRLPEEDAPSKEFEAFLIQDLDNSDIKGCKSLVDNYCHQLHSGKAQGNLRIKNKDQSESLTTTGNTINNFEATTFAFHQARLKQRQKLPRDLQNALQRRNFFISLGNLVSRPPRAQMTFNARIYYSDLESEVDNIWAQSIDEVVLRRLSKKFPQAIQLDDKNLPREFEVEYTRTYYSLWTEISSDLWANDPRWIKIKTIFDELKTSFAAVIARMNIPEDIKTAWTRKMSSVQLKTPGFNPAVASRDCITTSKNAYYYPYLNTITICAGYLNSGEQIQTLAHELAHSLDHNSRMVDQIRESELQKSFKALRSSLCKNKDFTCEQWQTFSSHFQEQLRELKVEEREVLPFHRCLKKNPDTVHFTTLEKEAIAKKIASETFSGLIKNSALFRITKKDLPKNSDGIRANPNYLNPCAYYTWDLDDFSIDGELASLLMFTGAYQCSSGEDIERMRDAIDVSKSYTQDILGTLLEIEGDLSLRDEMQIEKYSSPSTERFADRVGSYIVADYLQRKKSQYKDQDLRSLFLSASYWLCDEPTLQSRNYEEFKSLSDIIIDKSDHEDTTLRINDWLTPGIRAILQCEVDFEQPHCSLMDD